MADVSRCFSTRSTNSAFFLKNETTWAKQQRPGTIRALHFKRTLELTSAEEMQTPPSRGGANGWNPHQPESALEGEDKAADVLPPTRPSGRTHGGARSKSARVEAQSPSHPCQRSSKRATKGASCSVQALVQLTWPTRGLLRVQRCHSLSPLPQKGGVRRWAEGAGPATAS